MLRCEKGTEDTDVKGDCNVKGRLIGVRRLICKAGTEDTDVKRGTVMWRRNCDVKEGLKTLM